MSDPIGIGVIALCGALLIVGGVALAWALNKLTPPVAKRSEPAWRVDRDGRVHLPSRRVVLRSRADNPYAEALGKDGE